MANTRACEDTDSRVDLSAASMAAPIDFWYTMALAMFCPMPSSSCSKARCPISPSIWSESFTSSAD